MYKNSKHGAIKSSIIITVAIFVILITGIIFGFQIVRSNKNDVNKSQNIETNPMQNIDLKENNDNTSNKENNIEKEEVTETETEPTNAEVSNLENQNNSEIETNINNNSNSNNTQENITQNSQNTNFNVTEQVTEKITEDYEIKIDWEDIKVNAQVASLNKKSINKVEIVTNKYSEVVNDNIENQLDHSAIIKYGISVKNVGSINAENVIVTDEIVSDLIINENSIKINNNLVEKENIKIKNNRLTIKIGNIEKDESLEITFEASLKEDVMDLTKINNIAVISGDNFKDVKTNNVENIVTLPNLHFEKLSTLEKDKIIKEGEEFSYIIRIFNTGFGKVKVDMEDNIPEGLEIVEVKNGINKNGKIVLNKILEANSVEKVEIVVKVLPLQEGIYYNKIENTATVNGNETNTVIAEVGKENIIAQKLVDKKEASIGDILTYTLTFENKGAVSGIAHFEDTLPSALEIVEHSQIDYNTEKRVLSKDLEVKPGETKTFTYRAKVVDAERITNTLITTVDEIEQECTETTEIIDVEISKSSAEENKDLREGDIITYNINIKNNSSRQKEIKVLDVVPEGTKLISSDLELNENNLSKVITLKPNEKINLSLKVKILNLPSETYHKVIENTAHVEFKVNDLDIRKESENVKVNVVKEQLLIKKQVDKEIAKPGDEIKYQIFIENPSNAVCEVKNIVVEDKLFKGLKDVKIITNKIDSLVNENGKITANINTLKVGEMATLEITAKLDKNLEAGEKARNIATTNKNVDSNEVITTISKPEIKIDKFSSVIGDVKKGEEITYTILVSNTGNAKANVEITDILPQELEYIKAEDATYEDNSITWKNVILDPNDAVTKIVKVRVKDLPEISKDIENVAKVICQEFGIEETATATNRFVRPNITAIKEANTNNNLPDGKVKVGDKITYTFTIENSGLINGSATITDKLPEGLKFIRSNEGKFENGVVIFEKINVKPSEKIKVSFETEVLDIAEGETKKEIVNRFELNSKEQDSTTTNTVVKEKLEHKKEVINNSSNNLKAKKGDELTYKITVSNKGLIAKNIKITDIIPEGTKLKEGSINLNGTIKDKVITWNKNIKVNETAIFEFTVIVDKEQGNIENIASVDGKDTNKVITNIEMPEFEIKKSSNITGNEITYTIDVKNISDVDGYATILDETPANTTAKEGSKITWEHEFIKAGETKTYSFVVSINENTNIGTSIENTAKVKNELTSVEKQSNKVINKIEKTVSTKEFSKSIKGTNIVLTLDVSKSMNGDKINDAREAAINFVKQIYKVDDNTVQNDYTAGGTEIIVTTFSSSHKTFTYNDRKEIVRNKAEAMELVKAIKKIDTSSGTNIYGGLIESEEAMNKLSKSNSDKVLVFLGDGAPSNNILTMPKEERDKNNEDGIISKAREIKDTGIEIHTIGFGLGKKESQNKTAKRILRNMASSEDKAYLSDNGLELINNFNSITESVNSNKPAKNINTINGIVEFKIDGDLDIDETKPMKLYINDKVITITSMSDLSINNISYQNYTLTWNLTDNVYKDNNFKIEYYVK